MVLNAVQNADRTYGNLVYVDLEYKKQKTLLTKDKPRYFPSANQKWEDESTFVYFSNEDGFRNAYTFNLLRTSYQQLTNFEIDFGDEEILELDGEKYLFGTTSNPIKTTLYLINLAKGENKLQQDCEENIKV